MFSPESLDGIKQEIKGDRGQRDGDCDSCVESGDASLKEGDGAHDEKGIDIRHLVVECLFHPVWGVEYEDCWQEEGGGVNLTDNETSF